ncbi:MAG: hypothetical protein GY845_01555 [Planctomycetes bacterium]|nr:hypothetical protein [Planctomycetota bacterium]
MKEIPNLDELLNSFIDGELAPRQHTEVQRLLAHDETIAQRLNELQQCKMFLSSLPVVEAPPQILENVKASLARRTLLGEEPSAFDEHIGARHLLGRKLLAATAMFGLVAVLAAVVYSIIAPTIPQGQIADERRNIPSRIDLAQPAPITVIAASFSGRLELQTNILPAVVGIINRAIEENIPSDEWVASDQNGIRQPHSLICSSESFNLLLAQLDDIWSKLDSASLFVDTEVFDRKVVVEAVTAEQIADIVNQDDSTSRIQVARDFAVLNDISEYLPGREILTAIDNTTVGLITPPKPVLTWDEKTTKKVASRTGAVKNIHLTITVTDSN